MSKSFMRKEEKPFKFKTINENTNDSVNQSINQSTNQNQSIKLCLLRCFFIKLNSQKLPETQENVNSLEVRGQYSSFKVPFYLLWKG